MLRVGRVVRVGRVGPSNWLASLLEASLPEASLLEASLGASLLEASFLEASRRGQLLEATLLEASLLEALNSKDSSWRTSIVQNPFGGPQ